MDSSPGYSSIPSLSSPFMTLTKNSTSNSSLSMSLLSSRSLWLYPVTCPRDTDGDHQVPSCSASVFRDAFRLKKVVSIWTFCLEATPDIRIGGVIRMRRISLKWSALSSLSRTLGSHWLQLNVQTGWGGRQHSLAPALWRQTHLHWLSGANVLFWIYENL